MCPADQAVQTPMAGRRCGTSAPGRFEVVAGSGLWPEPAVTSPGLRQEAALSPFVPSITCPAGGGVALTGFS
jgi:hypothetical protein